MRKYLAISLPAVTLPAAYYEDLQERKGHDEAIFTR